MSERFCQGERASERWVERENEDELERAKR